MIHLLKEKDSKRTLTKCGIVITPKIKATVKVTVWGDDVSCPMCKPGSSEMYLVIEHKLK